jgi:hypothetical protein
MDISSGVELVGMGTGYSEKDVSPAARSTVAPALTAVMSMYSNFIPSSFLKSFCSRFSALGLNGSY